MVGPRRLAAVIVVALVTIAGVLAIAISLRGATGSTISGWAVGDRVDCSYVRCDEYVKVATDALDSGHPGHPEVGDATLYARAGLSTTSIGYSVVVFRFRDGTTRAIGVGAGVGPGDSGGSAYRLFAQDLDP